MEADGIAPEDVAGGGIHGVDLLDAVVVPVPEAQLAAAVRSVQHPVGDERRGGETGLLAPLVGHGGQAVGIHPHLHRGHAVLGSDIRPYGIVGGIGPHRGTGIDEPTHRHRQFGPDAHGIAEGIGTVAQILHVDEPYL